MSSPNLNKEALFPIDCSILINIPINYNDDVECNITHPILIPKEECNNLINK